MPRAQPRLSQALARARAVPARSLSRSPLTPSHDGKSDQEKHDSDGADEVRHHGNETGNVAGVGPYEADDRSQDEHGDHRNEPVKEPSSRDGVEPTLMKAFRQSKRQTLLLARSRVSQPGGHEGKHGPRRGRIARFSTALVWPGVDARNRAIKPSTGGIR